MARKMGTGYVCSIPFDQKVRSEALMDTAPARVRERSKHSRALVSVPTPPCSSQKRERSLQHAEHGSYTAGLLEGGVHGIGYLGRHYRFVAIGGSASLEERPKETGT